MLDLALNAGDLALAIFGFGLLIFFHELGHFLAARWAGVRVQQFAIGFGPAICSWRKGLGWRSGSTSEEYDQLTKSNPASASRLSPTEYRLNWLPLGGYVKMLGQEDLDPTARSGEPDSFNAKPVWKRLVIISAGVVTNVLLAAALFVFVFMIGLETPPASIGYVAPNSAAARAVAVNAERLGVLEPGLMAGDRVVRIDGRDAPSFSHIVAAAGLAKRGRPVEFEIARAGVDESLLFRIEPIQSQSTRLLELGVAPPTSTTLTTSTRPGRRATFERELAERLPFPGVELGMRLTHVGGQAVSNMHEAQEIFRRSSGETLELRFEDPASGRTVLGALSATPVLQSTLVETPSLSGTERSTVSVRHLLGLSPPTQVADIGESRAPLRNGDIFMRIGQLDWPNIAQVISEIRRNRGAAIRMIVLRNDDAVQLDTTVPSSGILGVTLQDALDFGPIVTRTPLAAPPVGDASAEPRRPLAAESLKLLPGTTILRVGGAPVMSYAELRTALLAATAPARAASTGADFTLSVRLPLSSGYASGPVEDIAWRLSPQDVESLANLGWESSLDASLFEIETIIQRADSPLSALLMGHHETKRVIVMTYVTLMRLFEGSVRVEHLRGPVGIAHIGAQIAERGLIHLLFLLAIISANLAVLNFLPLPIVDGGHAVFLIIEWITGKPVSVGVQNIATIIGLLLLGSLFIIVTFNDIAALFGR